MVRVGVSIKVMARVGVSIKVMVKVGVSINVMVRVGVSIKVEWSGLESVSRLNGQGWSQYQG